VLEREIDSELVWEIRFQRGDHTDRPRLLAARWQPGAGDYTENASRSLRGTADEVSEATQERYSVIGRENHAEVLAEQKKRLEGVVREIREVATNPADRKRLKSIEHHVRLLSR
jgi:hypothetical protein